MAYQQQTVYVQRPPAQGQQQFVQYRAAAPMTVGYAVPAGQVGQPPTNQDGTAGGRRQFARDSQKRCGSIQIVLGILAIIIGGASIPLVAGTGIGYVGAGIWCGIFMIIAGGFGVWSASTQTTGPIVTCMVMSILASCFGFVFFIMSAIACGIDNSYLRRYDMYDFYGQTDARLAMDACGILVGLAEIVVSIIQSAICCRTACCIGQQATQTVVYIPQPFPAAYALQNQGAVQATNIPAGASHVTVISPGGAVYPAVGYAPGHQQPGYAAPIQPAMHAQPQQAQPQQAQPQQAQPQQTQPMAGPVAPPEYSKQGPVPPAYSEKPPATNPHV